MNNFFSRFLTLFIHIVMLGNICFFFYLMWNFIYTQYVTGVKFIFFFLKKRNLPCKLLIITKVKVLKMLILYFEDFIFFYTRLVLVSYYK